VDEGQERTDERDGRSGVESDETRRSALALALALAAGGSGTTSLSLAG
jgi:hypothetical protein